MHHPVVFILPFLVSSSVFLGYQWHETFWLAFPGIYIAIPLLDVVFGRNTQPLTAEQHAALLANPLFAWLTWLMVPFCVVYLCWALWLLNTVDLSVWQQVHLTLAMGFVLGAINITTAHELIHKTSTWEQNLGGLLLGLVCYGTFKIEHVHGHHRDVATPKDASSAVQGQSVYGFVLQAIPKNVINGYRLNARRLRKRGGSPWSWRNELWWWNGVSIAAAVGSYLWAGWAGLGFFVGQSLCAIVALEMVNYVEHYGLRRQAKSDGTFERVRPIHSWNSSERFSNAVLFNLQRHSDHHAVASRRYQCLRHHDEAPALPAGYAGMLLVSLIPPWWRRVMDKRIPVNARLV